ncbi:MAG: hypothetical protein ACK58U_20720 [Rubrivivax sp.]
MAPAETLRSQSMPVQARRRCLQRLGGLLLAGAGPGLMPSASQGATPATAGTPLPLFDAHIHYSHDAVERVPPAQAAAVLRAAGLKGALVSSSDDEGTQRLLAEAPDLVVPELRPYRTRADMNTWVRDPAIVRYLEDRMARWRYVGIGEFHLFGADAELPVPRRMVALARERQYLLHAHSDVDAVNRLFAQWPDASVLWAHSGFEQPAAIREQLMRHPRLWCDLAYRNEHAGIHGVEPAWRELFAEFPDRFMVGTDTFTPERWHYIGPHATSARRWLASLPPGLAEPIAWRNAQSLLRARPPR